MHVSMMRFFCYQQTYLRMHACIHENEEEGDNEEDEEHITLVAIPADTSAAYKSLGENPAPQEAGSWFSSFPALEHASDIFHDDADDGDDNGDGGIGNLRIPL